MKDVASIVINNFVNDNRVLKEAITLQKNNFDITIVAVHEDGLNERESIEGINIHRVRLISRNWSKIKLIKLLKFIELTYKIAKEYKKTDILHCNDLDALFIGYVIKRFYNKNVKIVYDAHEYETERNGMNSRVRYLVKKIEKHLIKYVNKTITVSNAIADEYVRLYSIEKPKLVLNCPEYKIVNIRDKFRKTFNISEESVIFLYQGSLGPNRGVEVILEVFKNLTDKINVIVFMGYGPLVAQIQKEAKHNSNIFYHKTVDRNILVDYTASADFGISLIENSCLSHYYCLPNKMFEYIMAEIPIIVSNLPEMSNMIKDNNIGYVAKSDTVIALTKVIQNVDSEQIKIFKDNLKEIKKEFNWETQEKHLLKLYNQL